MGTSLSEEEGEVCGSFRLCCLKSGGQVQYVGVSLYSSAGLETLRTSSLRSDFGLIVKEVGCLGADDPSDLSTDP